MLFFTKVIFEKQSIGSVIVLPDLYKMKIVITAATAFEWSRIRENIHSKFIDGTHKVSVQFHKSGVGILASTYSIYKLIINEKPDLITQVGIAGCFDEAMEKASVVVVENEFLGDTGVEENGIFKDVFDLGLEDKDQLPFDNKKLSNPWLQKFNLEDFKKVNSITINEITTSQARVVQLKEKYNPAIETMEGAPLHYVCLQNNIPFLQVRAISNYIGERNKAKWEIKKSLINLQVAVDKILADFIK